MKVRFSPAARSVSFPAVSRWLVLAAVAVFAIGACGAGIEATSDPVPEVACATAVSARQVPLDIADGLLAVDLRDATRLEHAATRARTHGAEISSRLRSLPTPAKEKPFVVQLISIGLFADQSAVFFESGLDSGSVHLTPAEIAKYREGVLPVLGAAMSAAKAEFAHAGLETCWGD